MAKTAASQVNNANQYLPDFVSPTEDEYLAGLSQSLSGFEVDPITRVLKEGASEQERQEIRNNIDAVYDKNLSESNRAQPRVTSERYTSDGAGVSPDVTKEKNVDGLRRTDAVAIAEAQRWARGILGNSAFDGKDVFANPNLSYEQEASLLETFQKETGLSAKEIAQSPSLRAAFGRYMGKATGTLDSEINFAYELDGMESKNAENKNYKTPTPYVEPKILDQFSNVDNTLGSKQTAGAKAARTNKDKFVKDIMARGMNGAPVDYATAERMYDAQSNTNFDESIVDNLANERRTTAEKLGRVLKPNDISSVSSRMANRQYKAFEGFMNSMRNYSGSPMQMTRFTEKYLGGRFNEFSKESAEELVLTFMATHSALVESRPDAARMWSDMMMLAVLDHTLRNVYRYEQKKTQPNNSELADEETADAIKRFDETLMTGAADEVEIGGTIFKNMGFSQASPDQKAMLGSMAMSMTFETFRNEAPYTKGNRADFEKALVQKVVHKKPDGKTNIAYTLTDEGLSVAQDFEGLFNAVMPSSVRDVRYGNKKTDQTAINKLINMPVAKKIDGSYQYQGYTVPFGDTTEAAQQLEQAENVPVTIHEPTNLFLNNLFKSFQDSEYDLQYAEDMESILAIIDHPKFYNIKGDGTGFKGAFGQRPGRVYTTNRNGQLIHKDSPSLIDEDAQEITTQIKGDAHFSDDFSDKVKDGSFIQTLAWAQRNSQKIFYYDYRYGKNWRLSVDQTIGNYQHNKLARALVASGKPVMYELNNLDHVIRLKAGVMKRFSFDNLNPTQAALRFDSMIDQFTSIKQNPQAILKLASEHEGWASVTSILEAINIKERLDAPGLMTYKSSFFTEIDGKTNGLGHSAMQAGDRNTAAGAFIFDENDYALWATHYDKIEEFQSAGKLDELREYSNEITGDPNTFDRYLDAYNQTSKRMQNKFKNIRSGNFVSYPSMIQDKADFAMKQIMMKAQEAGGPDNFRRALEIFEESNLGRAFTKKPVMIFGYGAGGARHIDQVRAFVNEIIKRDGTLLQQFAEEGIDIDVQFIDPLGAMMSEAITTNFQRIKDFANMISLASNEAVAQGFDMFPVTLAGHRVPIGSEFWWLSQEKGANRAFSYIHPEHKDSDGVPQVVKGVAHEMKVVWDFAAKQEYAVKKKKKDETGQIMTVESMAATLRAATQAVVMLNHANDNINMQSGRMDRHNTIIAEDKKEHDARQAKLPATERKSFVEDHTTVGDTSLHIFDGNLVTPMEAEPSADALNNVFKNMNSRADHSHMQTIYKALTFDLDDNGELIKDEYASTLEDTYKYKNMNATNKLKTKYRRRLTPEGVALARLKKISTWDKMFDSVKNDKEQIVEPSMAFDWTIDDEKIGKITFKRSKSLDQMRLQNNKSKMALTNDVQHVKQFFYSTKSLQKMIKELQGSLDYMIKKPM